MKTIFALIIAMGFVACSSDEPVVNTERDSFSFSISAVDHGKFDAVIRWGVNGIDYNDPVSGHGYGSVFELRGDDEFHLQIDSNESSVELMITPNAGGAGQTIIVQPGKLFTWSGKN